MRRTLYKSVGYSANAEIVLQRAQKVLAVPEGIIEFSGDSTFVWVMTDSIPEQKFERRQIKTGMSDGIKLEIKEGLTGKEKSKSFGKERQINLSYNIGKV